MLKANILGHTNFRLKAKKQTSFMLKGNGRTSSMLKTIMCIIGELAKGREQLCVCIVYVLWYMIFLGISLSFVLTKLIINVFRYFLGS